MATSWISLSSIQKISLGLGIPASAAVAYILYHRYRKSRQEQITFLGPDDMELMKRVHLEAVKRFIDGQGA